MSYDNPNQCGYYEQETVPCDLCGTPTPMTGTRRCDPCWELERRVEQRPEVAKRLVAAMTAIDPDATTQLITRLTEALGDLVCNDCHVGIRNDTAVARAYTRDCRGCRPVRIVLAAVAKERAG